MAGGKRAGVALVQHQIGDAIVGNGGELGRRRRAQTRRLLDWEPTIEMEETIGNTLDFFLREAMLEIADKR